MSHTVNQWSEDNETSDSYFHTLTTLIFNLVEQCLDEQVWAGECIHCSLKATSDPHFHSKGCNWKRPWWQRHLVANGFKMLPYFIFKSAVPFGHLPLRNLHDSDRNTLSCYKGNFSLLQFSHTHLLAHRGWLILESIPDPLWIYRIPVSILLHEQVPKICFICDMESHF